jgi:hypothetical protein
MKSLLAIIILALAFPTLGQNLVNLTFTPESDKYVQATKQYQAIWSNEGKKIIEAMESVSGIKFKEKDVQIIVYEGVSYSGYEDKPMKLRASYPSNVKKATLIHELGHRLNASIPKTKEIDEHRALFLVLYDVWEKLYGKDFADKAVEVEKSRKGLYDYDSAWKWALSLSKEERAAKFKILRESVGKSSALI